MPKCMTDRAKIRRLRSALQTIYTWARWEDGRVLYPVEVERVCARALAETGTAPESARRQA